MTHGWNMNAGTQGGQQDHRNLWPQHLFFSVPRRVPLSLASADPKIEMGEEDDTFPES